jgi:XcyI restriction endonuclease
MDALSDALGRIDPNALKRQLSRYVPSDAQQILAAADVRHEHIFPTPIILETKPTLVGYYRLLLGVSQKTFYGTGMGLSQFKSMETRGVLSKYMASVHFEPRFVRGKRREWQSSQPWIVTEAWGGLYDPQEALDALACVIEDKIGRCSPRTYEPNTPSVRTP